MPEPLLKGTSMYNLPPRLLDRLDSSQFANLHTFFIVARCMSFLHAADELCLTPSAVSHRMKRLETALQVQLFRRLTRKISLTFEGERLFGVVQQTMSGLIEALEQAKNNGIRGRLTVHARPSIARCWLAPRLVNFASLYPDLSVDLRVGNESVDFRAQSIDLAIDYANGDFPGLTTHELMSERMAPVCSALYARRYDLYHQPQNIVHCTLLHDSLAWKHASYQAEWNLWAAHNMPDFKMPERGYSFDQSDLCVIAATNSLGIAIGRECLVQKRINSGELVLPYGDFSQPCPYGYYLIYPPTNTLPDRIKVFIAWLRKEADAND